MAETNVTERSTGESVPALNILISGAVGWGDLQDQLLYISGLILSVHQH